MVLFQESIEYQEKAMAPSKQTEEGPNVRTILSSLPPKQREVAFMIAYDVPQKEIAKKLKVDIRTIKRWVKEIRSNTGFRQLLKKSLED